MYFENMLEVFRIELPKRKFTVDEYHRLIETGILKPDDIKT